MTNSFQKSVSDTIYFFNSFKSESHAFDRQSSNVSIHTMKVLHMYILGCAINALTRTGTRPETRPEGGGARRGRHSMVQVFSSGVYWHIEIQVFFKSIPEKFDGTRTFLKSNFGQKKVKWTN